MKLHNFFIANFEIELIPIAIRMTPIKVLLKLDYIWLIQCPPRNQFAVDTGVQLLDNLYIL